MRSPGICLALAALTAASDLAAEPCFCLKDKDRVWYDCVTWRTGLGPDPLCACASSTDPWERKTLERGHLLKRIEAGQARCDPCRPKAPDVKGTMRPIDTDRGERSGSAP